MMEGLVVFLTERAKGAGVSALPGDVSSLLASTCADLANATTYKLRKPCKGMRNERDTILV